jgi:hypothetical protein
MVRLVPRTHLEVCKSGDFGLRINQSINAVAVRIAVTSALPAVAG